MLSSELLSGLRILEWAEGVSGPYCSKLLADMGAQVIKIETPRVGDPARRRGPFSTNEKSPPESGLFLLLNANKRGISLDPYHPTGRELFMRLIGQADCLIEDRPPGELKADDMAPAKLIEAHPSLVITSITPFGQTGPYSRYKAYPLNTYHAGGSGFILPFEDEHLDRPPVRVWRHSGEMESGLVASLATLTGLFWTMVSGEGQHIDVSKQEALMNLERMDLGRYPNEGQRLSREKRPYRLGGKFRCRDGYVVVLPVQENQWQGLMEFLGHPQWEDDEICRDEYARAEHAEEIHRRISDIIGDMGKEEVYHRGQAHGVPISPIFDVSELVRSPQLKERGFFAPVAHPDLGNVNMPTLPYVFQTGRRRSYDEAPRLGQHNEEIFCGLLGLTREELSRLEDEGVVA